MLTQNDLPDSYLDVAVWLVELAKTDPMLFFETQYNAITETSKEFNVSFDKVKSIFVRRDSTYNETDIPLAIFYHEYLRKIRDSLQ